MKKSVKRKFSIKILLLCILFVYIFVAIGSLLTSSTVKSSWYESIKPSITPPNYVFPIVWNILFFLIAVSLYFSWINADKGEKKKIAFVYSLNLILNVIWSLLFFKMQNPVYAFYEIFFLWLSIILMIYTTEKISKKSAWLLAPYLIWVSFASYLNWLIAF